MSSEDSMQNPRHRVRVFVDFWNYTLSMRDIDVNFHTDWLRLGPALSQAAASVVDANAISEYQGLNFYGSYNPNTRADQNLHQWATTVLSKFPGVKVSIVKRQRKRSSPACPSCYKTVDQCPVCGANMRGTEEKGVDVRMATDMISLAWVNNYDIAVLVSSDRDFVPVAEFLETKGIRVIHGAFPPEGAQLTERCWGSIDIGGLREEFRRFKPESGK